MTTTYKARPGSVAERAIEHLTAHGATASAPLADAIDADPGGLPACLSTAMAFGAIKREKRNGLWWYDIGDGALGKRDDDGEEEDDQPIVQRVVPAAAKGGHSSWRQNPPPMMTTDRPEVMAPPDEPPSSPVAKPEVAPDLRITISIECTPHQAERISAFVRQMREVA